MQKYNIFCRVEALRLPRTLCWFGSNWNAFLVRTFPKIVFWTFSPWVLWSFAPLRIAHAKKRFEFPLNPGLVGYFLCMNSNLHGLVPLSGYLLPFLATPSYNRPHTRTTDKSLTALNSQHSYSASAVHFVSSGTRRKPCPPRSASRVCSPWPHKLFGRTFRTFEQVV